METFGTDLIYTPPPRERLRNHTQRNRSPHWPLILLSPQLIASWKKYLGEVASNFKAEKWKQELAHLVTIRQTCKMKKFWNASANMETRKCWLDAESYHWDHLSELGRVPLEWWLKLVSSLLSVLSVTWARYLSSVTSSPCPHPRPSLLCEFRRSTVFILADTFHKRVAVPWHFQMR